MSKNKLKFLVDIIMFIDMCTISIIGFLMAFVIPKGEHKKSVEKYFMGLHRHDWGDIHFYLSILLLALLVLHLYLNWSWIVNRSRKHFGKNWKIALCIIPLGSLLLLGLFGMLAML